MGKPIIKGSLQPVRTGTQVPFDPTRGMTVSEDWEVAGDNLGGMARDAMIQRLGFTYKPNGRKSSLSTTASGAQAGFGDVSIDTWQLLANELTRDIKEHPSIMALRAGDPEVYGDALQAAKDYEEVGKGAVDDSWFTDDDTASILFRHLIHNITSYPVGQYVLRHTTNVSNRWDSNVADFGVERIYSTNQLLFEITNASFWVFPCPGRLVRKIEDMEVQVDVAGFTWGWRKLPSQETSAAGGRIDITQEYQLAGWSNLLYEPL